MRSFDTSFLVPLILPEDTSESIAAFFERLAGDDSAVSHWTRVELALPLARRVRMGNLNSLAALQAESRFETLVGRSFIVFLPNRDDFDRARDWLVQFETGMRDGDALHLAVAESRGADAIYTLDKPMIAAGKRLGLPTGAGIRRPRPGDGWRP